MTLAGQRVPAHVARVAPFLCGRRGLRCMFGACVLGDARPRWRSGLAQEQEKQEEEKLKAAAAADARSSDPRAVSQSAQSASLANLVQRSDEDEDDDHVADPDESWPSEASGPRPSFAAHLPALPGECTSMRT